MATATGTSVLDTKLATGKATGPARIGMMIFGVALVIGFIYAGYHLISDLADVHSASFLPYVLLGVALLTALAFEFVNGFHDTANAVATVIYTHSLEPHVAVVWSGFWNFIGVLLPRGRGLRHRLSAASGTDFAGGQPGAGFAMVFALLVAAIIWNLGTWYFGLPASSSHTLDRLDHRRGHRQSAYGRKTGTSGVDWAQAANIGKSLLLSPLVGFVCAALLLLLCKASSRTSSSTRLPKATEPPPFWIRCLLFSPAPA